MKLACYFLLTLAIVTVAFGQNKAVSQKKKNSSLTSKEKISLDRSKPPVYIDFSNIGQEEPLYLNESKETVFLKLVNNSKWSIYVPSFAYGENQENTGLYYDVELESVGRPGGRVIPGFEDVEVPRGRVRGHCCAGDSELKSGRSVKFSVPINHLSKNLKIRVDFNFDWEIDSKKNGRLRQSIYPQIKFSVFFNNSMLETFTNGK